jgi:hypothetical protein
MFETDYNIRTYRTGDEISIVRLFNSTFNEYSGFVPRSPQYWNWCCLQRPDVSKEGIIVVTQQEKVVGYAVAGKSGNIWEMCYDRTCDGEIVVTKIIARMLDYLASEKVDSVLLNFPTNDKVVRKICERFNFAESPPEYMFISILNFSSLINEILKDSVEKQKVNGDFLFQLKNLPQSFSNNFYLDIHNGNVTITDKAERPPEIILDVDGSTLISCIFSRKNVLKNILSSKIHVHPFWKIGKVMKLFLLMQNNSPWFMPRADNG